MFDFDEYLKQHSNLQPLFDEVKLSPRAKLKLNSCLSEQYKSNREFKIFVWCCKVVSIKRIKQMLLINDIFLSANMFVLSFAVTFSWLFTLPNLIEFFLSSVVYVHWNVMNQEFGNYTKWYFYCRIAYYAIISIFYIVALVRLAPVVFNN